MEGNTVLAALKSLARCQKFLSESLLENDGTQLEKYPSSYPIGIFLSKQLKLDKEKPSANQKQLEESLKNIWNNFRPLIWRIYWLVSQVAFLNV